MSYRLPGFSHRFRVSSLKSKTCFGIMNLDDAFHWLWSEIEQGRSDEATKQTGSNIQELSGCTKRKHCWRKSESLGIIAAQKQHLKILKKNTFPKQFWLSSRKYFLDDLKTKASNYSWREPRSSWTTEGKLKQCETLSKCFCLSKWQRREGNFSGASLQDLFQSKQEELIFFPPCLKPTKKQFHNKRSRAMPTAFQIH